MTANCHNYSYNITDCITNLQLPTYLIAYTSFKYVALLLIKIFKMVKKVFLNRERVIPNAQVLSVSKEERDPQVASSSGNGPVSGMQKN